MHWHCCGSASGAAARTRAQMTPEMSCCPPRCTEALDAVVVGASVEATPDLSWTVNGPGCACAGGPLVSHAAGADVGGGAGSAGSDRGLRVERNGLRNAYGARKSECACVMKTGDEGGGTTKGLGGLHKPAQVCRADVISGQCALDCEPRDWSVT
eukprot:scaffold58887_cov22-Tisochrysis_lutea.AAC.1